MRQIHANRRGSCADLSAEMLQIIEVDQFLEIEPRLTLSEAIICSYLKKCNSELPKVTLDKKDFFCVERFNLPRILPIISRSPDTFYRIFKSLEQRNIIEIGSIDQTDYIRFIDSSEPPKPVFTTFIYIMKDAANGFYKIGRSRNPKVRERTLQSEKPTIELIAYWQDTTKRETILHKVFAEKRIRGEWFNLTEQDVNNILSQVNPI